MDTNDRYYFIQQLNYVTSINLYKDNEKLEISKEDSKFALIIDNFRKTLEGYREMPAFGVSLNDETCEARKDGVWLEFCFYDVYTHNGMNYEKLLINIQENVSGFNIIRYYDDKYEGRCFYVDLDGKTLRTLFKVLNEN